MLLRLHVGNTALRAVASQSSLWRSQFLYETGPGFVPTSLNKRFLVESDRRDNLQLIYKLIGTTIHGCDYSATSCYITPAVPSRSQIRLMVQCTHNQLSRSQIRLMVQCTHNQLSRTGGQRPTIVYWPGWLIKPGSKQASYLQFGSRGINKKNVDES